MGHLFSSSSPFRFFHSWKSIKPSFRVAGTHDGIAGITWDDKREKKSSSVCVIQIRLGAQRCCRSSFPKCICIFHSLLCTPFTAFLFTLALNHVNLFRERFLWRLFFPLSHSRHLNSLLFLFYLSVFTDELFMLARKTKACCILDIKTYEICKSSVEMHSFYSFVMGPFSLS